MDIGGMDNYLYGVWSPDPDKPKGPPVMTRLASAVRPWASSLHNWTQRKEQEASCKRLESQLHSLDGDLAALDKELQNLDALMKQVKTDMDAVAQVERDVQNVKKRRLAEQTRQREALDKCRKKLEELQSGGGR